MKIYSLPAGISLHNIVDIATDIKQILNSAEVVRLDASKHSNPHLCLVQLVEIARRHAAAIGVDFALAGTAGSNWTTALERAGLLTAPSDTDRAFWHNGDLPQ